MTAERKHCYNCPNLICERQGGWGKKYYCYYNGTKRRLSDTTVPDWCPERNKESEAKNG